MTPGESILLLKNLADREGIASLERNALAEGVEALENIKPEAQQV